VTGARASSGKAENLVTGDEGSSGVENLRSDQDYRVESFWSRCDLSENGCEQICPLFSLCPHETENAPLLAISKPYQKHEVSLQTY